MGNIGSGDGTSYPTALDTQSTPEVNWPEVTATEADAEWANDVVAPILALQAELGITGAQNFIRTDGTNGIFSAAASEAIRILADGKVGINQTVPGAMLQVDIDAVGTKGLIVKGSVGQTGDLQQWQNSDGVARTRVDFNGRGIFSGGILSYGNITISGGNSLLADASNDLILRTSAADKSVVIIGSAGQSGNLQEWQDNANNIKVRIDADGIIYGEVDFITKGPWVDVRAYGAVGDGATDDTVAIQAAITAASVLDKTIYFPSGTFLIEGTLTVSSPIRIHGEGKSTILLMSASDTKTMFEITATVTISDIAFNGNDSNRRFIYLTDAPNFIIEGCRFVDLGGDVGSSNAAIFVSYGCDNGQISGNTFENISADPATGASRGIDVNNFVDTGQYSKNLVISGNSFSDIRAAVDGDAINIAQTGYDSNTVINGNTFYNILKRAIKLQSNGISVTGNTILRDGIGGGFSAISSYGTDNIIADNKISTFNESGYSYIFDLNNADRNRVTGNISFITPTYLPETSDGVHIDGTSAKDILIANNIFSTGRFAIQSEVSASIEGLQVIGNSYENFSTHVHYFRSTVDGLILDGNYADATPHNFVTFLTTNESVIITNNKHNASWGLTAGISRDVTNQVRTNVGLNYADDDLIRGIYITYVTAVPTTGTWAVGDRAVNTTNITESSPTSWICTGAGTPGTWVIENYLSPKAKFTPEGGIAVLMTNKTGAASVKGTLVDASTGTDNAVDIADASSTDPIGAIYDDGIADGSEVWVVVSGIAEVLLKDTTASTRGNWCLASDVAGRADATTASPPGAAVTHWQEIGHCLESKGAGSDVLAKMALHFN